MPPFALDQEQIRQSLQENILDTTPVEAPERVPEGASTPLPSRALLKFLKSKEFLGLKPNKRLQYIEEFMGMSEADQLKELATFHFDFGNFQEDPLPQVPGLRGGSVKSVAKEAGAGLIQSTLEQLGYAAGSRIPLVGLVGGPVFEAAGGYAGQKLSEQLGLRDQSALTDVLSVAAPLGTRAVGLGARALAQPAVSAKRAGDITQAQYDLTVQRKLADRADIVRKATEEADAANLAAQNKFRTQVREYRNKTTSAEAEAEAENLVNRQRYETELNDFTSSSPVGSAAEAARQKFLAERARIIADTEMTNTQRLASFKKASEDYTEALTLHKKALEKAPTLADRFAPETPYKELYADFKGQVLPAIDATPVLETAQKLGISLRTPAPGTQATSSVRLTEALENFATDPGGVTVQQVAATLQRVGRLTRKLERQGGAEFGAAKDLYGSLHETLRQAAADTPEIAKAVDTFLKAQGSYRKHLAIQDYKNIFGKPNVQGAETGIIQKLDGTVEIKGQQIYDNWLKLRAKNPFFEGSFSPAELETLDGDLRRILQVPPQKPPVAPILEEPVLPTRLPPRRGTLPEPPVEVEPQRVTPPEVPEPIRPDIPEDPTLNPRDVRFAYENPPAPRLQPFSPNIYKGLVVAGATVGGVGGRLAGLDTQSTSYLAGGLAVGAPLALKLSEAFSTFLLAGPKGHAILERIMAGKSILTPIQVATIVEAAHALQRTYRETRKKSRENEE